MKFSDFVPILVFLTFAVLLILVQRFWFLGAWHWIGTVGLRAFKIPLQITWFAALFLFVATFLDSMAGRLLSRTEVGKWIIAAGRIWLFASLFAFVLVKL